MENETSSKITTFLFGMLLGGWIAVATGFMFSTFLWGILIIFVGILFLIIKYKGYEQLGTFGWFSFILLMLGLAINGLISTMIVGGL
jgi:hypothetical protein